MINSKVYSFTSTESYSEITKDLPETPGVYAFWVRHKSSDLFPVTRTCLYVGQSNGSKGLKQRLTNHSVISKLPTFTDVVGYDLEIIQTSEVDLVEAEFIFYAKPLWNKNQGNINKIQKLEENKALVENLFANLHVLALGFYQLYPFMINDDLSLVNREKPGSQEFLHFLSSLWSALLPFMNRERNLDDIVYEVDLKESSFFTYTEVGDFIYKINW